MKLMFQGRTPDRVMLDHMKSIRDKLARDQMMPARESDLPESGSVVALILVILSYDTQFFLCNSI